MGAPREQCGFIFMDGFFAEKPIEFTFESAGANSQQRMDEWRIFFP
jgi:hypothetical protein